MTDKQLIRKHIQGEPLLAKVFYWTWVIRFRVKTIGILNPNKQIQHKVNIFNPITYVVFIVLALIRIAKCVIGTIKGFIGESKWI